MEEVAASEKTDAKLRKTCEILRRVNQCFMSESLFHYSDAVG